MLGPSHAHIFPGKTFLTRTLLVASTERPAMPASTPLLDALKAEKSAQRDKEAIQRNHAHYKDAAHASKKDESKKKAGAGSGSTSEAKQSGESAAPLGNEPRGGPQLQPRRRRPLSLAPRRSRSPETHPPLHPRPSHRQPLPARASPGGAAASSHPNRRPRRPVKPHRWLPLRVPRRTPVPVRPRLLPLLRLRRRALTVLGDGRGPCLVSRRGSLKRRSAGLASPRAAAGASAPERKKKKKKRRRKGRGRGSPRRMEDPLERRGRAVAAGGRKTTTVVRGAAAAPL